MKNSDEIQEVYLGNSSDNDYSGKPKAITLESDPEYIQTDVDNEPFKKIFIETNPSENLSFREIEVNFDNKFTSEVFKKVKIQLDLEKNKNPFADKLLRKMDSMQQEIDSLKNNILALKLKISGCR